MLHGQRLVLLVYLHLTLVVQYNIILIIINSIYTILLFANKQWGSYSCKTATTYNLPTTFKNICCGGCISGFGIANNIINREIRVSTSSVTIYNNLTNNEVIGNFVILLGK